MPYDRPLHRGLGWRSNRAARAAIRRGGQASTGKCPELGEQADRRVSLIKRREPGVLDRFEHRWRVEPGRQHQYRIDRVQIGILQYIVMVGQGECVCRGWVKSARGKPVPVEGVGVLPVPVV